MDIDNMFALFGPPSAPPPAAAAAATPTTAPSSTKKRQTSPTKQQHNTTNTQKKHKAKEQDTFDTAVDRQYGETLKVRTMVRHEVAVPPNYPYIPLSQHVKPEKPAKEYPFILDPFQDNAISCIQRNESVLVSAHTSAGKTVVAEYAIAQSLQRKQRVIYTSPIKALSNQKYRELLREFGDVGLMTGDVVINGTASCLVMTTEILRSMLLRGSEIMREVSWVIFDEIHYMRDLERGVIWEETIIMLPSKIRYVFLSATIPNALQFVEWITEIHLQPCHVVYTDYRPTPLQHYIHPTGASGIHLCVDEEGKFREDNFQLAVAGLSSNAAVPVRKARGNSGPSDLLKIVTMIMAKKFQPVIVFSFSKKICEENASQMSKLEFNDGKEKDMVRTIFDNAISTLADEDRLLPQVRHILPLLQRGIGIHHGGLLPVLKEIIEILFQEGLLKVLFATETFSIGLNMPAKTVVFTSVEKWDGKDTRYISGGEYIQMSGRAGRRGLDDRGIVIMMLDTKMEPAVAQGMLKGQTDPLNSAYHLKYNMILNMLRVEGMSPETILAQSFYQYQNSEKVPGIEQELRQLQKEHDAIVLKHEDRMSQLKNLQQLLLNYKQDAREVIRHPTYVLDYLKPGRLLEICNPDDPNQNFGWSLVAGVHETDKTRDRDGAAKMNSNDISWIVDVFVMCSPPKPHDAKDYFRAAAPGEPGVLKTLPFTLQCINTVGASRVSLNYDTNSAEGQQKLALLLRDKIRKSPEGYEAVDPVVDMKIKDASFVELIKKIKTLEEKIEASDYAPAKVKQNKALAANLAKYEQKLTLATSIKTMKKQLKEANTILMLSELKNRKKVARQLGYIDSDDVVSSKGRVACEITSEGNIVLTELMFDGCFNNLSSVDCACMLIAFVCDEKINDEKRAQSNLQFQPLIDMIVERARKFYKVSIENKLDIGTEVDYLKQFQIGEIMNIVKLWMEGASFSTLMKATEMYEGNVIRILRRLEEMLRQMGSAAKSIGNEELEKKFVEGIAKLKRGVVFAASLYLQ